MEQGSCSRDVPVMAPGYLREPQCQSKSGNWVRKLVNLNSRPPRKSLRDKSKVILFDITQPSICQVMCRFAKKRMRKYTSYYITFQYRNSCRKQGFLCVSSFSFMVPRYQILYVEVFDRLYLCQYRSYEQTSNHRSASLHNITT